MKKCHSSFFCKLGTWTYWISKNVKCYFASCHFHFLSFSLSLSLSHTQNFTSFYVGCVHLYKLHSFISKLTNSGQRETSDTCHQSGYCYIFAHRRSKVKYNLTTSSFLSPSKCIYQVTHDNRYLSFLAFIKMFENNIWPWTFWI